MGKFQKLLADAPDKTQHSDSNFSNTNCFTPPSEIAINIFLQEEEDFPKFVQILASGVEAKRWIIGQPHQRILMSSFLPFNSNFLLKTSYFTNHLRNFSHFWRNAGTRVLSIASEFLVEVGQLFYSFLCQRSSKTELLWNFLTIGGIL